MRAQPRPNSMHPDLEREIARRPAGASDPAKALAAVEAVLAVVAFAVLCAVVMSSAPRRAVEPDDGAYRHSIVAMTEGYFLTLSGAQVTALTERLRGEPGGTVGGVQFPNQWVELPDGRQISPRDAGGAARWRNRPQDPGGVGPGTDAGETRSWNRRWLGSYGPIIASSSANCSRRSITWMRPSRG